MQIMWPINPTHTAPYQTTDNDSGNPESTVVRFWGTIRSRSFAGLAPDRPRSLRSLGAVGG